MRAEWWVWSCPENLIVCANCLLQNTVIKSGWFIPRHPRAHGAGRDHTRKRWTPVLFPNPACCCLLLPLLMRCQLFRWTSLVQLYQKGTFMTAGIILKRRVFDGKYLMSSENLYLSLSCRNWFRRHRHTAQWTGFHQLRKCPRPLPVRGLARLLSHWSHRWKLQDGLLFFSKAGWFRRNCPDLCQLSWCSLGLEQVHFLTLKWWWWLWHVYPIVLAYLPM